MLRLFSIFFLFALCEGGRNTKRNGIPLVQKWSNSDCVRPWQIPQMSISTLRAPSRPIECNPDRNNCRNGRNPICQYSLRSQKYVCCEDKEDADIPTCPKYYETLLLPCGNNVEGTCPRGYKCLGSMGDENLKLCCKPNSTLQYREPESTFRENNIVPKILPSAPDHELIATFGGVRVTMGQLFDVNSLDVLGDPPIMASGVDLHDEKLYTIIMTDASSQTISWLVVNIVAYDGQLEIHRRTKSAVSYQSPNESDSPSGIHVNVLALFEQKQSWTQKELSRIAYDEFSFKEWIEDNSDTLYSTPIAATFFGYSTKKDDRRFT